MDRTRSQTCVSSVALATYVRRFLVRPHEAVSEGRTVRFGTTVAIALAIAWGLSACGKASPDPLTSTALRSPRETSAASSVSGAPVPSPHAARIIIARSEIRLPSPRSRAVALAFGSAILLCGGLASDGTTSASIVSIDLLTARASVVGALAAPVHDAGGAVLDGSGFIFGGGALAPSNVAQRVNASAAASIVGALPVSRADLASVAVDRELIVVGGGTPARDDDRVIATTDGHTFRLVARLVVGVRYPAVAVVGGTVYVIGGTTNLGDSDLIQAVDPRSGKTRIVGHLRHGLSHASAFVVGGQLLVAGGRAGGLAQDAVWRYDPARGTATAVGRLPYRVSDMASVEVGGIAYLIGGEAPGPVASIIAVAMQ